MRDYLNKVVRAHKKIWMFGSNALICSENNFHIHLRQTLEIIFFLSIKIIKFSCHGDPDIQYINNLEDVGLANNVGDRNAMMTTFRVYHYSKAIPVILGIAADPCKSEIIRKTAIEVLGWYHCSPYRFMYNWDYRQKKTAAPLSFIVLFSRVARTSNR